ncbi:hypothetical protein [Breoghania sp.]|nr:hypothetical protein [Breoghania sp.]MDJ0932867.1 hypothetical protein [Breoghania sp.]
MNFTAEELSEFNAALDRITIHGARGPANVVAMSGQEALISSQFRPAK